jgi:hypothetical protein
MGHFEYGSKGDRLDLGQLYFHGKTLSRFQMAIIERHRNQSFLEWIFRA